jgi:hypothetical protein
VCDSLLFCASIGLTLVEEDADDGNPNGDMAGSGSIAASSSSAAASSRHRSSRPPPRQCKLITLQWVEQQRRKEMERLNQPASGPAPMMVH